MNFLKHRKNISIDAQKSAHQLDMFSIEAEMNRKREPYDYNIKRKTIRTSVDNLSRWAKTDQSHTTKKNSMIDYASMMNVNKDIENTEILVERIDTSVRGSQDPQVEAKTQPPTVPEVMATSDPIKMVNMKDITPQSGVNTANFD